MGAPNLKSEKNMVKEKDKYLSKNLDHNIDLVFKSSNRQIMLSKISEDQNFLHFLHGKRSVQVISPSREIFNAKIETVPDVANNFLLAPEDRMVSISKGDRVIVLFNLPRGTAAISQANVLGFKEGKIEIAALDPRLNLRVKTRSPAAIWTFNHELFEKFRSKRAWAKRVIEYKSPGIHEDPNGVTDFLVMPPHDTLEFKTFLANHTDKVAAFPGLLTDISTGGCCIYVQRTMPLEKLQEYVFTFIEFSLPTLERATPVRVLCAVRHIRQNDKWLSLHCMFLEALPDELVLL